MGIIEKEEAVQKQEDNISIAEFDVPVTNKLAQETIVKLRAAQKAETEVRKNREAQGRILKNDTNKRKFVPIELCDNDQVKNQSVTKQPRGDSAAGLTNEIPGVWAGVCTYF